MSIEFRQAGVEVLAICRPDFKARDALERAQVDCQFVSERSSWDPIAAYQINRAATRFGAQLMHTHLSRATRLGCRSRLNIPLITSIHHYGSWRYYRGADHYMPITRYAASFVRGHHVPDHKIRILSNFTCTPAAPPRVYRQHRLIDCLPMAVSSRKKDFRISSRPA